MPCCVLLLVVNGSPNPFRSRFTVSFTLPQPGHVEVTIFAPNGRQVGLLADETMTAGVHTLTWNAGRNVPSGVYYYTVRTGATQSTSRVTRLN